MSTSSASAALHNANEFDKSVAKQAGHEYAAAPYSIAKKAAEKPAAAPAPDREKDTRDLATGIGWRIKQQQDLDSSK